MSREEQAELIESVLVHVSEDRRNFLRQLLTATGALLTLPLMTSMALAGPDNECFYWEKKVKKGKFPGDFSFEYKKKKCPADWFEAKKGKRFDEFYGKGKGKKGWYLIPDE